MGLTAREIIRIIEADGWYFHSQKGSHMHFKHPAKLGRTTVPFHGSRDLSKDLIASILRQAGLR